MCKRRNQNSTKDLKQQLIKNGTYQNRDYQGKTFEKKNTTGGEFNSILKNSVMEKSDILCITNRKLFKKNPNYRSSATQSDSIKRKRFIRRSIYNISRKSNAYLREV